MTTAFRALVRKDMRIFFSDRRAVLMSFVAPIAIASFFGYLFGGGGNHANSAIPVLIVDQDSSAVSRSIISRTTADKALQVKAADAEQARAAVRKGSATVAVIIPKDFGRDAARALFAPGQKPRLDLLYDPSHGAELAMVNGMLTGDVMQAVAQEAFSGQTGQQMLREEIATVGASPMPVADRASLLQMLSAVERWNERSPRAGGSGRGADVFSIPFDAHAEAITSAVGVAYNGYAHAFAGMGVQFILFMGLDAGIALLLLRQRGLWQRLRAAPVSRGMLLGSRAVSMALIALIILLTLFGFARAVFGVRVDGSMAGFLAVCVSFALMTASFGLLVAALGKTPEATRGLSIFATLMMVMLGGAWVPSFLFPAWLQKLTVIVPTRWAMDGLDAMTWRGLGFSSALLPVAGLLTATLIFGSLALMRFRWEDAG
jgi:ABC-2 type transport system permease protein